MNTRLQVEHPVTEMVTGRDLVRAQLVVADGEPLPWTQDEIAQRGHAIEARVYAEDPSQSFLPQAGRIARYVEPQRPGVRVDAGIVEGGEVSVYYDPMIAKVIASAETRDLAIARLAAALREFTIEGIRTNLPFLITVLESQAFRAGAIDTAYLEREHIAIANQSPIESTIESTITTQQSTISRRSYDPWDGVPPSLAAATSRASARQAPSGKRRTSGAAGTLTAPMPATIIKVHVKPGDAVKKGDTVLVLEAMKMELPIRATGDGVIASVRCKEGELVQADAVLVEFQ